MGAEKYSSYDVLNAFFDDGSFSETDAYLKSEGGEAEAVTGFGTVDGVAVYAFAQNVDACGGAMSKAQAKKITKIYSAALKTGAPVVGFYRSVGGRLEQKYELLSAYGDILRKSAKLSGVVPQISIVLGSCLGTSALIAASADYIIMEKDAKLSVDTTGENASADDNLNSGIVSFICEGYKACVDKAKDLLGYFPANNLEPAPAFETVPAYATPDKLPKYFADENSLLCVGGGYGEPVCTAFGRVNGYPVGIIVTKGGTISADSSKKMSKHVRFCDAFSIPVITIVDAEQFDSLHDASKLVSVYAEATTAKISIVSGTAVGAVYIALAGSTSGADLVYALPEAVVSPIAPKAAAFILDDSIADAPVAEQDALATDYVKANLSAVKAAEDGYVDDIVEPDGLRDKLVAALDMLSSKRVSSLPKKHSTL
ncbi:MAG: carboxyl transferase [Ruminococcus sp.]|uniref:carboxyl transferase domain-containing protein n=1 Tax=Ruminococcus sp. TaxID=41978 RepID=UPI00287373BF|nr:carboxyl transferase domain-containing protein [Ruminococcus sp.]MBQ3285995.1 carboxyl transferase [Ruminococcus sp.]